MRWSWRVWQVLEGEQAMHELGQTSLPALLHRGWHGAPMAISSEQSKRFPDGPSSHWTGFCSIGGASSQSFCVLAPPTTYL